MSGDDVIPAVDARKHTWQETDPGMIYYNAKDEKAIEEEMRRRNKVFGLSYKLANYFWGKSLFDVIEMFDKQSVTSNSLIPVIHSGKSITGRILLGRDENALHGERLYDLATNPIAHPIDDEGEVLVVPVNLLERVADYNYFKYAKAVLFILNHSATTSKSNAEAIAMICQRRISEGRPLAAFAVCENGEQGSRDPKTSGVYPSANILRDYVVLVPGHIKPTIIKLWAIIHKWGMNPSPELINFMLTDHLGEVNEDMIYQPEVLRVINTAFV